MKFSWRCDCYKHLCISNLHLKSIPQTLVSFKFYFNNFLTCVGIIDKVIVNYLQVYYMPTKTKFNVIYCNHMVRSHSIIKSTFPIPFTFPS